MAKNYRHIKKLDNALAEYVNYYSNYYIQTKTKLTPLKNEVSLLFKNLIFYNCPFFVLSTQFGAVKIHRLLLWIF